MRFRPPSARVAVLTPTLLLVAGCASYDVASSLYADNPDLRDVSLAGGNVRQRTAESLGIVYGAAEGSDSCEAVAARALRRLLEEARALGGTKVVQAQFRGRWAWMGRPVCRRSVGRWSAEARGFAVAEASDPEP